jgi:integrase/recombinase XerC
MLKEKFEQFLVVEKKYSEHTVLAYVKDLEQLDIFLKSHGIEVLFAAESVRKISHRWLRLWMSELLDEGLSARSVGRKISAVKSYFNFLQKSEIIDSNPAKRVKIPGFEKSIPSFLKENETEALFDMIEYPNTFEGARDQCMLEVLYGCGLRRSELIQLTPSDIDFFQAVIRVKGKGNKERLIPFGKKVKQALESYLLMQEKEGVVPAETFFVRKNGLPVYPKLVYRVVDKYLGQICSLTKKSPHVLRHTFATHLLDHGADLNAIKELLGHSSLSSTQVYTHNSITKLKNVHKLAHPRAEN